MSEGFDWKKFVRLQLASRECSNDDDNDLPFKELDPTYHRLISAENTSISEQCDEYSVEQQLLISREGWLDSELFSKKYILEKCDLQHYPLNLRLFDHSERENPEKAVQDMIYETVIIQYLNPLFYKLHHYVEDNFSKEQLKNYLLTGLSQFLELSLDTCDSQVLFENVIDLHYSTNRDDKLLAFLVCIPWLETGMRDALFLYDCSTSIDKVKESLLNRLATFSDMLGSDDLLSIYGENGAFILKLCYGSQNTLNLRNVSMHGFINSHNFNPHHTTFLLFLMCNLGFVRAQYFEKAFSNLNEKQKEKFLYRLKERKMNRKIQEHDRLAIGLLEQSILKLEIPHEVSNILSVDLKSELNFLQRMNPDLPLISKNEWNLVLESYVKFLQETSQFQTYITLSRIFPIFEAFLRRLFVFCNVDNKDIYHFRFRMLQVERTRSLVIFDTILNNKPNDYYKLEGNRLFDVLNEHEIHCLYDLFKWPHGIKIRTFMAHGCIHWDWISKRYLDRLMILFIQLVHKFSRQQEQLSTVVKTCNTFIECYSPCFHPQKMLKDDIYQACGHLQQVEHLRECSEFCEMLQYFGEDETTYSIRRDPLILELSENETIITTKIDENLNALINHAKESYMMKGRETHDFPNTSVSSIIICELDNFLHFDVEEISEKEFKLLLLARRMSQEISECLNFLRTSLISKWKKIQHLNATQKTTLRTTMGQTERLRKACEFCLFVQLGILKRNSAISRYVAGCDRFLAQCTASLTKSQIDKCFEMLVAFTLSTEEIENLGIIFIHLKNKTLIKSLYHKQK
nr:unnamed protein product [Naegleria fowleri]